MHINNPIEVHKEWVTVGGWVFVGFKVHVRRISCCLECEKKKDFDYPRFHLVTITYYYQYILTKFVQVKILSLGIQGIILFVLFFF